MGSLDEHYWSERYLTEQTGWDIGYPSPPLIEYAAHFDKSSNILIPGAGRGHEALYLAQSGFTNINVVDLSSQPLKFIKEKDATNTIRLIHQNFFEHDGFYDLILEQTFFCALNPQLRLDYARKMVSLLSNNGILAGVLFNTTFPFEGPPFGGSTAEYQSILSTQLKVVKMEECYNSIPPRSGKEVFFIAKKSTQSH